MNKIFLSFFLMITVCLTQMSACSLMMSEEEKYIQGTWRLSGELPNSNKNEPGMAWYLEYTFDKGKFKQTGYPPITQEGKYKVIKQDGNKLTLELYDQKGTFGTENKQMVVVVEREKNKLTIDGKEGFSRAQKDN